MVTFWKAFVSCESIAFLYFKLFLTDMSIYSHVTSLSLVSGIDVLLATFYIGVTNSVTCSQLMAALLSSIFPHLILSFRYTFCNLFTPPAEAFVHTLTIVSFCLTWISGLIIICCITTVSTITYCM